MLQPNASYPLFVNRVLERDLLRRDANDPIRAAFELACEMHAGQMRKGNPPIDYITLTQSECMTLSDVSPRMS